MLFRSVYELSDFYKVLGTTISSWIRNAGGILRESNRSRYQRREKELPALNHSIVSVERLTDRQDVYNMEVDDTECYFANEVLIHNCPKTHQPDFASICIQYDPDELCVETKSLKLYLFAYRNQGSFMESITRKICDDFVEACDPLYCKVTGEFAARGGIAITVVAEHSKER